MVRVVNLTPCGLQSPRYAGTDGTDQLAMTEITV